MVGYWQAWSSTLPKQPTVPLLDVPDQYNVIEVSFGKINQKTGAVNLQGDNLLTDNPEQSKKDIEQLEQHGTIVVLSVGGENTNYNIDNNQKEQRFVSSLEHLIKEYSFQGVGFDIENGITVGEKGNVKYLINIIKQLKKDDSNLLIILAPQTTDISPIAVMGSGWNDYVPIVNEDADDISWVQMQEYNSGHMPGLDGKSYPEGNQTFLEKITPVLIEPWTRGNVVYNGLPANKVVIGLPATDDGAAPARGFVPFDQVKKAIVNLRKQYPTLGGVMTWNINWDEANNYAFIKSLSACVLDDQCN